MERSVFLITFIFIIMIAGFVSADVIIGDDPDVDVVIKSQTTTSTAQSNTTFSNATTGSMYNYSSGGYHYPVDSPSIYYNLTNLTYDDLDGFSFTQASQTLGGSYLTMNEDSGKFKIDWSISFKGGATGIYGMGVAQNFVINRDCYARRTTASAIGNVGGTCLIDLTEGGIINFQIEDEDNPSTDVTIYTMTMVATRDASTNTGGSSGSSGNVTLNNTNIAYVNDTQIFTENNTFSSSDVIIGSESASASTLNFLTSGGAYYLQYIAGVNAFFLSNNFAVVGSIEALNNVTATDWLKGKLNWSYIQDVPDYVLSGDIWGAIGGNLSGTYNETYDQTSQDVTANRSEWFTTFNQTYDETSQDVTANRSEWFSMFNETYESTFNTTYDQTSQDVTANRSEWFSMFNETYESTFNETYNNLLGQDCPSGYVVNGTLNNGSLICTVDSGGGGNPFDQDLNTTNDVEFDELNISDINIINDDSGNALIKSEDLLNGIKLMFCGTSAVCDFSMYYYDHMDSDIFGIWDEVADLSIIKFVKGGNVEVTQNVTANWFKGMLNWSDVQNAPDIGSTYNSTYESTFNTTYDQTSQDVTANRSEWFPPSNYTVSEYFQASESIFTFVTNASQGYLISDDTEHTVAQATFNSYGIGIYYEGCGKITHIKGVFGIQTTNSSRPFDVYFQVVELIKNPLFIDLQNVTVQVSETIPDGIGYNHYYLIDEDVDILLNCPLYNDVLIVRVGYTGDGDLQLYNSYIGMTIEKNTEGQA